MDISVKDLVIKYKDFTAVDGISFEVGRGEIFGIIGPNGAGKTSTIECLEGLKPYSGSVEVLGIEVSNHKKLYGHIGVQLQEASFPDYVKVGELCRLFASFYEKPMDYNILLKRFGIDDKKNAYVKKLSGGQRQKVSIVMALISNPQIVFLDELTTGLDPESRLNMWELIKSLRDEGKTVYMTTHFMEEAEYLCDRVCLMVKGKIAAIGKIADLVEQARLGQKIEFSSKNADCKTLGAIAGVSKAVRERDTFYVYGNGKNFLRAVVVYMADNDIDFYDLSCSKSGLSDVFFKLTGFGLEAGAEAAAAGTPSLKLEGTK